MASIHPSIHISNPHPSIHPSTEKKPTRSPNPSSHPPSHLPPRSGAAARSPLLLLPDPEPLQAARARRRGRLTVLSPSPPTRLPIPISLAPLMHERSSGPSLVAATRLRSASLVLLLLALSLLAGWARFWWCREDDEGCSLMGFRGDDSPATGGSVPVGGRRGLAPPPATAPVVSRRRTRSPGARGTCLRRGWR